MKCNRNYGLFPQMKLMQWKKKKNARTKKNLSENATGMTQNVIEKFWLEWRK